MRIPTVSSLFAACGFEEIGGFTIGEGMTRAREWSIPALSTNMKVAELRILLRLEKNARYSVVFFVQPYIVVETDTETAPQAVSRYFNQS
mgnify:CR=1 FL=1